MVEVASSNLVTPTRFESPNLYDWGFFYTRFIRVVAQIEIIHQLKILFFYTQVNSIKNSVCLKCAQGVPNVFSAR